MDVVRLGSKNDKRPTETSMWMDNDDLRDIGQKGRHVNDANEAG